MKHRGTPLTAPGAGLPQIPQKACLTNHLQLTQRSVVKQALKTQFIHRDGLRLSVQHPLGQRQTSPRSVLHAVA